MFTLTASVQLLAPRIPKGRSRNPGAWE